jgi:tetratricopeptide (TPR) repeat protein
MKKLILLLLFVSTTQLLAVSYWDMKKEAYALYKGGDKERAIKMVEEFVQEHPKSYKGQNLLAVLHYWSGDMEKAQKILEGIVSKTTFLEAEKLLRRINKRVEKKKKVAKKSYKSIHQANRTTQLTDLEYLLSQVEQNPQDIENRILLSKFYFKMHEYQKAYDLAHEVLEVDPHQKKMQTIVAHLEKRYKLSYSGAIDDESVVDKEKAKRLLKQLHKEKKYNAYYNLYEALKSAHVSFTQQEYIDILHTAIMLGKYKEANALIAKGRLPVNKQTLKVQLLLSKKLSQSVASR